MGLTWAYFAYGGDKALSLVTIAVLARVLVPEDFGIIAAATLFIGFVDALRDVGIKDALTYKGDEKASLADTAFILSAAIGLSQMVAALLLAPFAQTFSDDPRLSDLIMVMAPIFLINSMASTHDALLHRQLKFRVCYSVDFMAATVRTGVVILCVLADFGIWSFPAGMLTSAVVRAAGRWAVLPWRPSWRFDADDARLLMRFGLHVWAASLIAPILFRMDQLSILSFLGEAMLAVYVVALRLPDVILGSLGVVVSRIMFPVFVRIREDGNEFKDHLLATARRMVMASAPIGVGLALVAPIVLPLAFGDKWGPAIPVMQILALALTLDTIPWAFGDAFKAVGRPGLATLLLIVEACYMVPAIWSVTYLFQDVTATAAVVLACSAVTAVLRIAVACSTLDIKVRQVWAAFQGTALAAGFMAVCVLGWQHMAGSLPVPVVLAGSVTVGAVAYILSIWLVDRHEARHIIQTILSAWQRTPRPDPIREPAP